MVNTSPKKFRVLRDNKYNLLYFSMITNNIKRDFNALHIFLNSVLFCEGCYILHYTFLE